MERVEEVAANYLISTCGLTCKAAMLCCVPSRDINMDETCNHLWKSSDSGLTRVLSIVKLAFKVIRPLLSIGERLLAKARYWWESLVSSLMNRFTRNTSFIYRSHLVKVQKISMEQISSELRRNSSRSPQCLTASGGKANTINHGLLACLESWSFGSITVEHIMTEENLSETTSHWDHLEEPSKKAKPIPLCTNPIILSMIYCAEEEEEEEDEDCVSDWSDDLEKGDVLSDDWRSDRERDSNNEQEGLHETEGGPEGDGHFFLTSENDGDSDWSDDGDSDWSSDSEDAVHFDDDGEQLWNSFSLNDPYNPLCFSEPIESSFKHRKEEEKGRYIADDQSDSALKVDCETSGDQESNKSWNPFCQSNELPKPSNISTSSNSKKFKAQIDPLRKEGDSKKGEPRNGGQLGKAKASAQVTSNNCHLGSRIADAEKEELDSDPEGVMNEESLRDQTRKVSKKVRFSSDIKVHQIIAWDYAYRAARKGPWEQHARDRCRFRRRIAETEAAIGYCFLPQHREEAWRRLQENQMQTE